MWWSTIRRRVARFAMLSSLGSREGVACCGSCFVHLRVVHGTAGLIITSFELICKIMTSFRFVKESIISNPIVFKKYHKIIDHVYEKHRVMVFLNTCLAGLYNLNYVYGHPFLILCFAFFSFEVGSVGRKRRRLPNFIMTYSLINCITNND